MQSINRNTDLGGRRSGQDRRVSFKSSYKGIERRLFADRRKGVQQRRSPRFRAKEGSFAAINSNYGIIGLIKNINKCGLAFEYIPGEKQLAGQMTIDIFHQSKDFYLKNLRFNAISDFYVDLNPPFSSSILKQCCGKFAPLTDKQASQIDYFIQKHTFIEA